MKKILMVALACLLMAGCTMPILQSQASLDLPPQAWIDAPLNGSTLPLAPYEVVFHGSDVGVVTQGEFSVNGDIQSSLPNPDSTGHLIVFRVNWTPPIPGEYTLRARTLNSTGGWSDYAEVIVTVGEPTFTPTFTPTVTQTPTATPALAGALAFANGSSPKQVRYGACTPNQVTFEVNVSPLQAVHAVLLFTRMEDSSTAQKTGWDSGTSMNPLGAGSFRRVISTASIPGANTYSSAYLNYQFVATGTNGQVLGRSDVYYDIVLARCGYIFARPRDLNPVITPTFTVEFVH